MWLQFEEKKDKLYCKKVPVYAAICCKLHAVIYPTRWNNIQKDNSLIIFLLKKERIFWISNEMRVSKTDRIYILDKQFQFNLVYKIHF